MQIRGLSLEGAWEITPKLIGDSRGMFLEWSKEENFLEAVGHPADLKQANCSVSAAGVVRGIGYELQGCIRHWQKRHPDLRIFLTGGDRFTFSDALRKNILTDSHLVARGLNKLLLNYMR